MRRSAGGLVEDIPPQPVIPWNTTRNAGNHAPFCIQYQGEDLGVNGIEDCLYLNVYTPQLPTTSGNSSLPVLFYIHQGGFSLGSGSVYGPRYLLDHNLVLVTINYRLGIMGFLSTEDIILPGNNGLKDQVAALRWVQKNIPAFGGNPREVTIAGASSGATSVQYHYLSRMSRGLFKRGICMSGSALQPSSLMKGPILKTLRVAQAVRCSYNLSIEIVNCLRSIPANRLVAQEGLFQFFYYIPFETFGPTVERVGEEPFITQLPYEMLRTGEVTDAPILFSSVTHEGLIPTSFFLLNSTGLRYLNRNWLTTAPALLDFQYTVSSANMNQTSNAIRQFYFGNRPINYKNRQPLIQMVGDRTFTNDDETAARMQAYVQSSPVYFYHFGYRGQYSVSYFVTGSNRNLGVSHTDDNLYILNSTFPRSENTRSDREMIRIMSGMWANFTINGVPSVGSHINWQPINKTTAMSGPFNFIMISSPTSITPNRTSTFGHPRFWNNLPINEPGSGRPSFHTA